MMVIIPLCILIVLAVVYWRTSRFAYESVPYVVVNSDADFEIRDYSALVLADTPMSGGTQNSGSSFRRLFNFIAGANNAKQKIAMTTPVLIDSESSAPRMSFVMPAGIPLAEMQKPTDQSVALREVKSCRYAVLRFAGPISEKIQNEYFLRLTTRMKAKGLEARGVPLYAFYDPPWTPPFLRRNEVLIQIAEKDQKKVQ